MVFAVLFSLSSALCSASEPFFRALTSCDFEGGCDGRTDFTLFHRRYSGTFSLFSDKRLALTRSRVVHARRAFTSLNLPLATRRTVRFRGSCRGERKRVILDPNVRQLLGRLRGEGVPVTIFAGNPRGRRVGGFGTLGLRQ